MKEGWEYKRFEDALEKVKYTKKLQTNEFLSEGRVPIISQEEDYISGFWNNPDDAYKVEKPIVIFGDHSRVIKYVDFDFVLGADGVKILKPIESLNAKFLYHYLKWYNVPNMGYSRHYKFLKEINMPVPPLKEQQQIVSELDLLSGVIEKQKAQLEELDKLAQSIFYDMFGDPVTNEKGWEMKMIGDICLKITDGSHNPPKGVDFSEYLMLSSKNVTNQGFTFDEPRYLTKEQFDVEDKRTKVQKGDVFLVIVGASVGKCCIYQENYSITLQRSVAVLRPNTKVLDSVYLKDFLVASHSLIVNEAKGAAQKGIYLNQLAKVNIPLPPLSLQHVFAAKIEAIEAMKTKVRQSLKEAETLFNERMDYYFN